MWLRTKEQLRARPGFATKRQPQKAGSVFHHFYSVPDRTPSGGTGQVWAQPLRNTGTHGSDRQLSGTSALTSSIPAPLAAGLSAQGSRAYPARSERHEYASGGPQAAAAPPGGRSSCTCPAPQPGPPRPPAVAAPRPAQRTRPLPGGSAPTRAMLPARRSPSGEHEPRGRRATP